MVSEEMFFFSFIKNRFPDLHIFIFICLVYPAEAAAESQVEPAVNSSLCTSSESLPVEEELMVSEPTEFADAFRCSEFYAAFCFVLTVCMQ